MAARGWRAGWPTRRSAGACPGLRSTDRRLLNWTRDDICHPCSAAAREGAVMCKHKEHGKIITVRRPKKKEVFFPAIWFVASEQNSRASIVDKRPRTWVSTFPVIAHEVPHFRARNRRIPSKCRPYNSPPAARCSPCIAEQQDVIGARVAETRPCMRATRSPSDWLVSARGGGGGGGPFFLVPFHESSVQARPRLRGPPSALSKAPM